MGVSVASRQSCTKTPEQQQEEPVPTLHPRMADKFRRRAEALSAGIRGKSEQDSGSQPTAPRDVMRDGDEGDMGLTTMTRRERLQQRVLWQCLRLFKRDSGTRFRVADACAAAEGRPSPGTPSNGWLPQSRRRGRRPA